MVYEKLFLNKNLDLFIDEGRTIKLWKHQKDGLRFLYGQYKKNALGVILNDPSGSGRRVQTVLFLSSLHQVLEQPILVLSDYVQYYEQLFHSWTNQADAVICNSQKITPRKRIFLNDFSDIAPLSGSDWSIVVVENEEFPEKLMKQLKGFRTEYKIVVISTDLKKDIPIFFRIYQWIFPNNTTFCAKDFVLNKKTNNKEKGEKALLLDCFYETIVLRRTDTGATFKKDEASWNVVLDNPQKKNKDKSGTKIKRTRKNTENGNGESTVASQDHEETERKNKRKSKEHEKNKIIEESTLEQSCTDNFPIIIDSNKSKRLRIIESDSDEDMNGIKSSTDIVEVRNVNEKLADTSLLSKCRDDNEARDHSTSVGIFDSAINEDEAIIEKNKVCIDMDNHIDVLETEKETFIPENNKANITFETAIESCIKDHDKIMSSQKTMEVSEDMFSACDILISQTNEMRNDIEVTHDESNLATGKVEKELVTSCNKINTSVFDNKLKEMEEKAYKKFKGSILDSIF